MRFGLVAMLLFVVPLVFGQSTTDAKPIDFATPPQVFIVVSKHPMGADLVRVTVLDPAYSSELLKLQCGLVAQFAGSEARATEVSPRGIGGSGGQVITATFACENLIDYENDRLNLSALVKGFLGSANPMVSSFLIQFEGELVSDNTLQIYVDDTVLLEGKELKNPTGIEYRVEVLTQDTRLINIPGSLAELPPAQEKQASNPGPNPVVYPILIGGTIVAGALVYFALLRPGQKTRKK